MVLTYGTVPEGWYEHVRVICVCIYGHIYSKSKDQPGKVANPARRQLNTRSRLSIWSRETVLAVPSRASLLISMLRLNLVLTYGKSFRGGVHLFI